MGGGEDLECREGVLQSQQVESLENNGESPYKTTGRVLTKQWGVFESIR